MFLRTVNLVSSSSFGHPQSNIRLFFLLLRQCSRGGFLFVDDCSMLFVLLAAAKHMDAFNHRTHARANCSPKRHFNHRLHGDVQPRLTYQISQHDDLMFCEKLWLRMLNYLNVCSSTTRSQKWSTKMTLRFKPPLKQRELI